MIPALLATALACAAGDGGAAGAPGVEQMSPPLDSARLDTNREAAIYIVVAELLSLGEPPAFWSGRVPARQQATYRVLSALKAPEDGPLAGEITVWHPVVSGSPTANADTPGLSPALFRAGQRYVLFLKAVDGQIRCLNERDGVLPATDELISALR